MPFYIYDLNGNLLAQTVNGQTFPDGHSDSYGYTGLGMRLTKSDLTGNYSYLADGVSPTSDVLTGNYSTSLSRSTNAPIVSDNPVYHDNMSKRGKIMISHVTHFPEALP